MLDRLKTQLAGETGTSQPLEIGELVLATAAKVSGLEIKPELSLNENGLASLGVVQFVTSLEAQLSTPDQKVSLPIDKVLSATDLIQIIAIVKDEISRLSHTQANKEEYSNAVAV